MRFEAERGGKQKGAMASMCVEEDEDAQEQSDNGGKRVTIIKVDFTADDRKYVAKYEQKRADRWARLVELSGS